MTDDRDSHGAEDFAFLLPFYANGTLSVDERARVEAALADDADLRAELEEVQTIQALVHDGGAGLARAADEASPQRLKALLSRIEAESPPVRAAPRRNLMGRRDTAPGSLVRPPARFWKPAFAAAAALAVVQLGVIAYQARPHGDYVSLSGPQTATPAAKPGMLLLRLAPDARWADVQALLSSHGLSIVGGPHGDVLDVAPASGAQVPDLILQLRASPLVAFVGPAS